MKNIILHKINGDIYSYRPYGVCESTSSSQDKVVQLVSPDVSDINHEFSLVSGATILVTFTDVNNTSNTTLNVNNTGAKPIFIGNTELSQNQTWVTNDTIEFRYDGEHWIMLNGEMSIDKTYIKTLYTLTDNINTTPTLPTINEGIIELGSWDENPPYNDFVYGQNIIWSTTIKVNYKSNTVFKDPISNEYAQFTNPIIVTGQKGDNGNFITEYVKDTKTLRFTTAFNSINLNLKEY